MGMFPSIRAGPGIGCVRAFMLLGWLEITAEMSSKRSVITAVHGFTRDLVTLLALLL
jgi:hypothetical protein